MGDPDSDPALAEAIWLHALAVGFAPTYLTENEDGVQQDWPRIPLPATGAALLASAALGRETAALLDVDRPVVGVTNGTIRPELRTIGAIKRADDGQFNLLAGDLDLTVGWGHKSEGAVMPGKGRRHERAYRPEESELIAAGAAARGLASEAALALLGEQTSDVWLNDVACWRNVPERVWDYTIGGYQVIKKWLSYREKNVLGRGLTSAEAVEVTGMIRRLAALVLLEPALNRNYAAVVADAYRWPPATV